MKLLLISALFLTNITVLASNNLNNKDFDVFWRALCIVESRNNPKAIGDKGKAIGIAQIHRGYFEDAREFEPKLVKYNYLDCFQPDISKLVVKSYISKYSKNGSIEDMARLHNSGPGWKKKKQLTNHYVNKILKEIDLKRK